MSTRRKIFCSYCGTVRYPRYTIYIASCNQCGYKKVTVTEEKVQNYYEEEKETKNKTEDLDYSEFFSREGSYEAD